MPNYTQRWQTIYQDSLAIKGYKPDIAQSDVIDIFARIEREMTLSSTKKARKKNSLLTYFLSKSTSEVAPVKGLYLYGTVGRGKTFLMDLFCTYVPFSVKRLHFHHFMKSVHDQLAQIKHQENPLAIIAADFAAAYRILCLDEFMVTDITDAMLLYGLLNHLTECGVVIVTTTNIPPDDLYKDGLQRQRFLPAIQLIKETMIVHEITAGRDFRRLCLQKSPHFFTPLNSETQRALRRIAMQLSEHLTVKEKGSICIYQRDIAYVMKSQEVIWFTFSALCEGYRSQLDYIELAKRFPVFIVSDIPVLDTFKEDAARRFLWLVDELYDRRLDLVVSSAVPVTEIYTGKKMVFEFQRLQSRLFEMQSEHYGE